MPKKKSKIYNKSNFIVAMIALVVVLIAGGYVANQLYIKEMYPLEYSQQIKEYSDEYDLDPILVASLIRTESNFARKAESKVGAIGLMQIMPDTASWLAKDMMHISYEKDDLYDADYNIRMGCRYIKYLNSKFDNTDCVLAAYNAGPNKVNEWLNDKNCSRDGKTLFNIPFEETANYVEKINNYYEKYKKYHSKDLM